MDGCDLAEIWIALATTRELGDEERARLEAHLAECEACAEVRAIAFELAPRPRSRAPVVALVVAACAVAAGAVVVAWLARPAGPELARLDPSATATPAPSARESAAPSERGSPAPSATASSGAPPVVAIDDLPAASSLGAGSPPPGARAASGGSAATAGVVEPTAIPDAPSPDGRGSGAASPPPEPDSLGAASIQEVVSRNRAGVRKACWASGAEQRAANLVGVSSVKVRVKMTITPSGKVASAAGATPDPRFADVASCTARQAASWRFPTARGTTSIIVPFVFVLERPAP